VPPQPERLLPVPQERLPPERLLREPPERLLPELGPQPGPQERPVRELEPPERLLPEPQREGAEGAEALPRVRPRTPHSRCSK
jgi:hypothetical protein